MKDVIKMLYENGYYQNNDLPLFIEVGWLTADDYQQMTGTEYVPSTNN